jgi:hypothetical protein
VLVEGERRGRQEEEEQRRAHGCGATTTGRCQWPRSRWLRRSIFIR